MGQQSFRTEKSFKLLPASVLMEKVSVASTYHKLCVQMQGWLHFGCRLIIFCSHLKKLSTFTVHGRLKHFDVKLQCLDFKSENLRKNQVTSLFGRCLRQHLQIVVSCVAMAPSSSAQPTISYELIRFKCYCDFNCDDFDFWYLFRYNQLLMLQRSGTQADRQTDRQVYIFMYQEIDKN